ncbi:MAG: methionine-rich copper-binding protein CopC, partial [Verrucomicrobiales bacterium]
RTAGSIPVHLRHLLPLLLTMVFVLALGSPASAAARLLSSSPSDGASLEVLDEIEFEFDSLLLAEGADITITKLDGTTFDVAAIEVDGVWLRGEASKPLPSGNYSIDYSVRSSDGARNDGSIRISIDSPDQALSGGLIAVIAIFSALCIYLGVVFRVDQKRHRRSSGRGTTLNREEDGSDS